MYRFLFVLGLEKHQECLHIGSKLVEDIPRDGPRLTSKAAHWRVRAEARIRLEPYTKSSVRVHGGHGCSSKWLFVWTVCRKDACYARGAPLFFLRLPKFGCLIGPLPKTDLEENETATG